MPIDKAALATERQVFDKNSDADDYHRHLAAEIVAMLPYVRTDALTVLRLVHDILQLTPERPRGEP